MAQKIYECQCRNCNRKFDEQEYKTTQDKNKCIFHCNKENWREKENSTKLKYFWDKFKQLIEEKEKLTKEDIYYRFNKFIFPHMRREIFENYNFETDLVFNKTCQFMGDIEFFKCIFKKKVYFNDCGIEGEVNFGKSLFKNKFYFNNIKDIKSISFRFAKFEKKVEFKETNFKKTDFEDISVFTNSQFKCDVDFQYTTFNGLGIFRKTVFEKKLDLIDSIFNALPNFLEATSVKDEIKDIDVKNRETARIIKDSFEQQNNIIEANRFYALEMKKYEDELKKKKDFNSRLEYLIFKIHGIVSNHSQDWFQAFLWIILISLFSGLYDFYCINENCLVPNIQLYQIILGVTIFALTCYYLSVIIKKAKYVLLGLSVGIVWIAYLIFTKDYTLTYASSSINPFSMMDGESQLNIIQLLFKGAFAYLIYQFIISIRQNTRRK